METYSPEKNTIIFLLDRLDYDYMEQVLETDPDFFAPLDGFTSFTNATSEYARTKPAANFMFTGNESCLLTFRLAKLLRTHGRRMAKIF